MNINWRYVLGVGTLVGVVGFTAYAIKKAKDQKKIDEESMTVEDARREVAKAMTDKDTSVTIEQSREFFEANPDYQAFLTPEAWKILEREDVENDVLEEVEIEDVEKAPEFTYDEVRFDVALIEVMTEEDTILRHEPSSNEARNQFIRMELAEWRADEETYSIMLHLFQFPFNTENDGDWDLKTNIIDHRVQFFGFGSRWAKEVTFADVILYYARAATYNVNESVRYWVNYFLQYNEFELLMTSHRTDELLYELNSHTYHNKQTNTYGLFGINSESMENALHIASRNVDNSLTYQIEFNEFLKECM